MRFECNCKSDRQLVKMLDEIHKEKAGFNFEIAARLWYTPIEFAKAIMVEHQVSTKTCRELTENDDEPDWFTAYVVDNEQDYDCSEEIFTETVDNCITINGLKEAMYQFAKEVEKRFIAVQKVDIKSPIDEQIQSACCRSVKARQTNSIDIMMLCDAYNRSDLEALLYLKDFCDSNNRKVIDDLMSANLNFYEEGYHEKTSIKNEDEYHDKKWELFELFGVTRDKDDQMIPSSNKSTKKEVFSER